MRRQCGCLPHRLLHMHSAPVLCGCKFRRPKCLWFLDIIQKFTRVNIFDGENFVASQQVRRFFK
ncbi:hypothetical protein BTE56_22435 [Agrobacterium pusense]|nr:hypothetical protein BTE56_22435 [Agrobacterium pusense]